MVPRGQPLPGDADLVILPGSKTTIADMQDFLEQGWDIDLAAHLRRGRQVLAEVKQTLARAEQVFVVYPLVEESQVKDLKDATRGFEQLERALPGDGASHVAQRVQNIAARRVQLRRDLVFEKCLVVVAQTGITASTGVVA